MDVRSASDALMRLYPRIYFACHRRHVRDPGPSKRVVSAHAASILDHLDTVEAMTVSALAAHMGVTASTMSLALDRLESHGYVRRRADRVDARRVGVVVTAAGDRVRKANSVLDPELVDELMKDMSPEDRAAAIHGLALVADAARSKSESRRTGSRRNAGSVLGGKGGK